MQHPALAFAIHSAAQLVLVVLEIAPAHAMTDAMEVAPAHVVERVGILVWVLAVVPAQKSAYLNVRGLVQAIVNRIVLQVVIADAKVATGAPGVLDHNLLLVVVVIALVHVLVLVELVPDAVD